MNEEPKILASISGGKDSLAALITHIESGGRCDGAIYCRIMFDDETSAEYPEHEDFLFNKCFPTLEREYGVKTTIVQQSYTTSMAKVSTLADTSVVPLETLKTELVTLSGETGVAVGALAEAAYQALSAGVDTADVVNFVATASSTTTTRTTASPHGSASTGPSTAGRPRNRRTGRRTTRSSRASLWRAIPTPSAKPRPTSSSWSSGSRAWY